MAYAYMVKRFIAAQRANKQLDTSAAGAVQSTQTFENCILPAQEPLCKQEEGTMAKQRMRICIGYNDDGTQVIKQISAQNEIQLADKAVQEILKSERGREFIAATGGVTSAGTAPAPAFKAYTGKYFAIYRVPRLKKTSIAFYRGWLKHFYSEWDDTPIDKITTQDIQNFLNARKEMSQKSLKDMLTFLKSIFKSALKDGVIQTDPADDNRITIPSTKKKKRKALKADDVKDIIQQLPKLKPMDRRFMALSVYNGLRRGEILGLRWEDIDLETKTIHIRRNVTFAGGVNEPSVGTTKTESGERDIPFIPEMLEYLSPLGAQGYVIGDGDRPITHSVDRRMRERIAKTIDAHGATSHVLRHTYATLLNDAGTDIKTIQALIGDADYSTTANRYVHAREEKKQEAMLKVGKLLT